MDKRPDAMQVLHISTHSKVPFTAPGKKDGVQAFLNLILRAFYVI